ncbi:MAG TPA: ATP-binding cassette domain-containing protein [Gemmatimonadaceae bacterium]|nr:ATP-binding cassette domain-containing protein [Gemmatimonadaceae bacterium]
MSRYAIDIQNIAKSYDGHVAVRDLSLQVPVGSVYGLLGPNGAGKTTTIRMILDIIRPDRGSIALFGRASTDRGVRDAVGYLPEERGLYKKMQVRRMLMFLAELKGVPHGEAGRRIDDWLARFSLTGGDRDWGLAKVDELSRGMQQKVQFIATLLHDPELVVLDEPFSGLDPINAQALKDAVIELRARGKTVIFSTHVMENAERMCDAVCIIARGEKILDGPVATVKREHGSHNIAVSLTDARPEYTVVFSDTRLVGKVDNQNRFFECEMVPGSDAQELLRRLVTAGASIERFELIQPSLHQIFIQRVGDSAREGAGSWANVEKGMSGHG